MEKPRVIIADTDDGYIIPLQNKLIDSFFNRVHLEIITEESYFDQLFSSLQKVDILIVSDFLYSASLQRHSIAKIFVLTEQESEEKDFSFGQNVVSIYKYKGVLEILNILIGESGETLKSISLESAGTKVILVCSANGGVGKTTLALGVSAYLSDNYKRCLYIDAERLQSFQYYLSNSTAVSSADVYAALLHPSTSIYSDIKDSIRNEGFSYLPRWKASMQALGLDTSVYPIIVSSAKLSKKYDYILVDTDCVFDESKTALINAADIVVFVFSPERQSALSMNLLLGEIDRNKAKKFIYVCNKFDQNKADELNSLKPLLRYSISEHVKVITECHKKSPSELAKLADIQRLAFLIS